jgi:hypothetical protein
VAQAESDEMVSALAQKRSLRQEEKKCLVGLTPIPKVLVKPTKKAS